MDKKQEKVLKIVAYVVSAVLTLLLIFGMTCVISKFDYTNKTGDLGVFGTTTARVDATFSESEFDGSDEVLVKLVDVENIKIGDYVRYVDDGLDLNSTNTAQFNGIDGEIVSLTLNGNYFEVNRGSILGVIQFALPSTCGFVNFLCSLWPLFLFVIIPALILIAIIAIFSYKRLAESKTENDGNEKASNETKNSEKASDKDDNTDKKSKKAKKEKPIKPKLPPKVKNEKVIGDSKQIEFDFESLDKKAESEKDAEKKSNKKTSKNAKASRDDNHLLLEPKEKGGSKRPKKQKPMRVIEKPMAKRQGDDYVFRVDPPMDTNTPIKEMLDKITNSNDDDDEVQNLLDKMRKQ